MSDGSTSQAIGLSLEKATLGPAQVGLPNKAKYRESGGWWGLRYTPKSI